MMTRTAAFENAVCRRERVLLEDSGPAVLLSREAEFASLSLPGILRLRAAAPSPAAKKTAAIMVWFGNRFCQYYDRKF